jgi:2-keto-4-pentenoate hydratase/2-oxohepta-3-ene-1,7-dioic acid hydratase in catechol pathway
MRIITFTDAKGPRIGVIEGDQVRDVCLVDNSIPRDLVDAIARGPEMMARIRAAAVTKAPALPASGLKVLAPIPRPRRNVFCVGKNYFEHAAEFHNSGFDASSTTAVPDLPIIFTKPSSSVIATGEPIPASDDKTNSCDYEGELTVVIGKGGRGISKENAFDHVFGYTIINDVTARTQQHAHKQWFLGKSRDGFCPMGPCVVTADEVPDVRRLQLQTWVNDERRQNASVADLIFDVPTLIACISEGITLEPGDLIATGTPVGVGIGFKPPKYLKAGDVVRISIAPIGDLVNPVV